jgi:tRNA pseudouridine55 synthase
MTFDGFLVVDKPPGVTSHDIVAVVRAVTGLKKVGHTGTLDPFATGVLPLALGGATRLIGFLDESLKVYDATVQLGAATDTGDPTGTVVESAPVPELKRSEVERVLATFVGERDQVPPRYSAVKVAGRPLYSYARAGQEVEVKSRRITIHQIELLELGPERLRIRLHCSRGSYARVIAEELGVALGTLGHLSDLRREGSGRFGLENSVSMSRLSLIVAESPDWVNVLRLTRREDRVPWRDRETIFRGLQPFRLPPRAVLGHLPSLTLSSIEARRFVQTGASPTGPREDNQALLLIEGSEIVGVLPPGGQRAVVLAREPAPVS